MKRCKLIIIYYDILLKTALLKMEPLLLLYEVIERRNKDMVNVMMKVPGDYLTF